MKLFRGGALALCMGMAAMMAFSDDNNSAHGWLLVANKGDHTIGAVDPSTGAQTFVVDAGGITPHEVIASPDGKTAFAPIYGDSGVGKPGSDGTKIIAIDLATRKITNTLDFGRGVRPHCPLIGPKDGMLYVTTELDKAISVIDPKTMKVIGAIPTGQSESHMLAITRDGRHGYTANVGPGTVSVLDMVGKKTITIIPISKQTQRISLSADDKWVFTADQMTPRLAAIDTSSNTVKHWIDLPAPGYGTAATPDGKWLIVAVPKANKVVAVDLATMKVAHSIDVPAAPQESLVRPDGKVAYVSCDASGKIAEISLTDWKMTRAITAGKTADGLAWAAGK